MTFDKMCLGTVQFGMNYGVSNMGGQVGRNEVDKILEKSRVEGIKWLDTSSDYGGSEQCIGQFLSVHDYIFHIMTKSQNCTEDCGTLDDVRLSIRADVDHSMRTLGRVDVLYVRNLEGLFVKFGGAIARVIDEIKQEYGINKIGSSVYTREDVEKILEYYEPQVLQVPHSILDLRLKNDGTLFMLKNRNVEVHVRSIFLQGLIFMDQEHRPAFFDPVAVRLDEITRRIRDVGITPLEAALHYVLTQEHIDRFLFGVTSLKELQEICHAARKSFKVCPDWDMFALEDAFYLNPVNWRL